MVSGSPSRPSVVDNSSLSFADIAPGNNAQLSNFCGVLTIELESTRSLAQYRVHHAHDCSNIEYLTKNKMT